MSLVQAYLDLTAQIKALTEERALIGAKLPSGRSVSGGPKDVSVSYTSTRRVCIPLLRKYVTEAIIDRCISTSTARTVRLVAAVKPKECNAKHKT